MCCVVVLQCSQYIAACKKRQHIIPDTLTDYIVGQYVEMRRDARNNRGGINQTFTSARTLLALLRLSTALVRQRVGVRGGGQQGRTFTSTRTLLALLCLSTALVRQGVGVRGGGNRGGPSPPPGPCWPCSVSPQHW